MDIIGLGAVTTPNSSLIPWALIWGIPYIGAAILAILFFVGVKNEKVYGWGSVLSIGLGALLSADALAKVLSSGPIYARSAVTWVPWLNIKIGVYLDGLGAIMAVIVSVLSFLIAVYSTEYMKGDWGVPRYFFFFTFFVASMLLLVTADNLVLMFIGWEGTGLASYALIGHWYTDEEEYWVGVPGRKAFGTPMYFEPSHSGVRALMFTRIGDIGLLIGMSAIYLLTHTFSIPVLAANTGWIAELASKGVLTALLIVFSMGALAKSAQFPFQEWLVTAMTGPTPVSALIHAATMVKAGVYFMLRMAPVFLLGVAAGAASAMVAPQLHSYFLIMAGLGAITAFMMATMALVSNELKLILAYSTASQLGYMFLGVAAAGVMVSKPAEAASLGVAAGLSHLMSHAIFKAALFLIAGWLIHVAHSRFIDYMGNYAKYMKLTALSMWLAGLSLMAIPPLSGFFSKELTLKAAEEAHLMWVWALGAITAGLTAAYTLRMILRVMHLPPKKETHARPHEAPPLMLIPYLLLSLTALVLGLVWFAVYPGIAKALSETLGIGLAVDEVKAAFTIAVTSAKTLGTLAWVGISFAAVAYLYMVARVNFDAILERSPVARAIHDFLFDRWYINAIIYIVIVGGFAGLSMILAGFNNLLDLAYHAAIPALFALGAAALRTLHRGKTNYYLMLYVYFASLILLFIYIAWG